MTMALTRPASVLASEMPPFLATSALVGPRELQAVPVAAVASVVTLPVPVPPVVLPVAVVGSRVPRCRTPGIIVPHLPRSRAAASSMACRNSALQGPPCLPLAMTSGVADSLYHWAFQVARAVGRSISWANTAPDSKAAAAETDRAQRRDQREMTDQRMGVSFR